MKKSSAFVLVITGILFFIFSGCSNFLEGSVLKGQLVESIKIANAEQINVRVEVKDAESGRTIPQDIVTFTVGVPVEIEFRINSIYLLKGWVAIDRHTKQVLADAVEFIEEEPLYDGSQIVHRVKAILKENRQNVLIRPVCSLKNDTCPPVINSIQVAADEEQLAAESFLEAIDFTGVFSTDFIQDDEENPYVKNRVKKIAVTASVQENGDDCKLCIYEYPFDVVANDFKEPLITEYADVFTSVAEEQFELKHENENFIIHDIKSANQGAVKIEIYVKDAAGNHCTNPGVYYVAPDNVTEAVPYFTSVLTDAKIKELNEKGLSEEEVKKIAGSFTVFGKNCEAFSEEGFYLVGPDTERFDFVTYTWESSTDGNTYTPLQTEYFEKRETMKTVYGEFKVHWAQIELPAGYFENMYVKAIGTDEIGNTAETVVKLKKSVAVRDMFGSGDEITVIRDNFKEFGVNYKQFLFHTSEKLDGKWYITASDTINNDGSAWYKFYNLCINTDETLIGFISDLTELEAQNVTHMSDDYKFDLENGSLDMSAVLSSLSNLQKIDFNADIEIIQDEKNSGTVSLKFIPEDGFKNSLDPETKYPLWAGMALDENFGPMQDSQYAAGNTKFILFRNLPSATINNSSFFFVAFNASGEYAGVICYTNSSRIAALFRNIPNVTIKSLALPENLTDNTSPHCAEGPVLNTTDTELSFLIEDDSGCSYEENGLPVKVYYSTSREKTDLEKIMNLPCLNIEYRKSIDGKLISMCCDVSALGKGDFYLYIYAEDESGNWLLQEEMINRKFQKFDSYSSDDTYDTIEGYAWDYGFDNFSWSILNKSEGQLTAGFYRFTKKGGYYPVYRSLGNVTCNVKNLLWNSGTATICFDQPCIARVFFNDRNAGDNPADWEVCTPENQKNYMTVINPAVPGTGEMQNYDYIGFSDSYYSYQHEKRFENIHNKYYCVIVNFADGTSLMSPVSYKK